MARALRIQLAGSFYHLTCRGNERKAIYRDDADRQAFLSRLRDSLRIYQVELHAYVLMDNHFHLMVRTERANLSEFMRHFNISYTSVFNRRRRRVGHLYQGRYRAIVVDRDSYLLELSRYVHLNPVRIVSQKKRPYKEQMKLLEGYRCSRVLGPLLDRIDIQIEVPGLRYQELASKDAGEASVVIRERVNQARKIQLQRFDNSKIHANAQMGSRELKRYCAVKPDADRLLETAINKLGLSARAYSRVLKVGRTIADLAGSENIEAAHIAEAIQYRSLDRRM